MFCVTAKYYPHSSANIDHSYSVTSEQHASVTGSIEGTVVKNPASCLSLEQDRMLTDVCEVISYDTVENYETFTSSAASLTNCELKPTISAAHMALEVNPIRICSAPVSSVADCPAVVYNSGNAASTLWKAEPQSPERPNALAAAFASHKQLNQPRKPS